MAPRGFVDKPYPYHHELELTVDNLTNTGLAVCRHNGWVVMTQRAIPGERVRVRIHRNHPNYSEADLVEILESSPDRIEARCFLFGICGGCQYQHMTYESQLQWKRRQVEELLRLRTGETIPVEPVIPSPLDYGYRSKITPHFEKPRSGVIGPIGFHHAERRSLLVDVPRCDIAVEAINQRLPDIRDTARRNAARYRKGATLLLRAGSDGVVRGDPNEPCEETVDGIRFRFKAGGFFQNNPSILPAFVRHVAEQASATGNRFLIDAYCGSGLFALTAARHFDEVLGVEVSGEAVRDATRNAEANGITHVRFREAPAGEIFSGIVFPPGKTTIILDPPRAGCDEGFLSQLFAFAPSRIIYISCNPATQLRDMKSFTEAGCQLRLVQPFDLFPQTRHLECVMTWDGPENH
jgi:23S rRNA (uracil1939-C5)-methyltransferase/tRNA (uracil-5-)-methyltransferase